MSGYGSNFYDFYQKLNNPNSNYYGQANRNLLNTLNASTPTVNSLLGIQMALGGSYKSSLQAAQQQRKAIETRNAERANQGTNQLYAGSQGNALNALQGAENAYQYQDSQPGFLDYLAAPISTIAGNYLGGLFGQQQGNGIIPQTSYNMQNYQYPNNDIIGGGFYNPAWR